MNSSLIKLALLGTDAQSPDFSDPLLEPFADVFAIPKTSAAKRAALAIGIEALIDQASPRKAAGNGESLFSLVEVDPRDYLPLEVADAFLTILETRLSVSVPQYDRFLDAVPCAVVPFLRTFAQHGLKIPPERAAAFIDVLLAERWEVFAPELVAAVEPPNVRELVKYETSLPDALRQIPLFLESRDVPLGVSLDEIERFFLDETTKISSRLLALKALRALAPDRARAALETLAEDFSSTAWRNNANSLIPCLAIRVGANDAPFLKAALKHGDASSCGATGELLAKLREPEYLDSIVQFAESHMSRDGMFSQPNVRAMKLLKRLGLYFGKDSFDTNVGETLTRELFKRIPLERWEKFFEASPEEILAKTSERFNFPLVLAGLRASFLFHNGPRNWEEPLNLRWSDAQTYDAEAKWFETALSRVDFKDATALRAAVDRFRAREFAPPERGPLMATRLAFFEPYPWRPEFADYYDAAVWNELNRFGKDDDPPSSKSIPLGLCRQIVPNVDSSVRVRKTILERLLDKDGVVEPIDYKPGSSQRVWNSTAEFARALWTNTLPVLHLAPRRLRQKYSELGRLFYERCVSPSSFLDPDSYYRGRAALRDLFPAFDFTSLNDSNVWVKAVEIIEGFFLSLSRPE